MDENWQIKLWYF